MLTIPVALHDLLASGSISTEEVIRKLFAAIEAKEKTACAYLSLADPEVLIEEAWAKVNLPLRGLLIAVKDNISTLGFSFGGADPPTWSGCI